MLVKSVTEKWNRDTGLVFALIALFFAFSGFPSGFVVATVIIVVLLFFPFALYPLSFFWFNFAKGLNFIMTKVFFGAIFFVIITPVGLIRKIFNRDPLSLRSTKTTSFVNINRIIDKDFLKKPF